MGHVTIDIAKLVDRVAVLTISDPKRRNAITPPMVHEIIEAVDALEHHTDVGALVVTGEAPAFCAGADLSALAGGPSEAGLRGIYEAFLRIGRSPLPTIAAVNGAAVGAGTNLALCCDVIIAGRSARFDTRFLSLGLHPGGGHTWMLRRRIGAQFTAAMDLFGEVVDGTRAAEIGLAWRVVEDDELLGTAAELAGRAAAAPPELARRLKGTMARMAGVADHDAAVTTELEVQLWSMAQPEFRTRLDATQSRISSRSEGPKPSS